MRAHDRAAGESDRAARGSRDTLSGGSSIADPLTGRDRHRPQTREDMRAAVHDLEHCGWTDYAIAHATGLAVEQVRRLIGERA